MVSNKILFLSPLPPPYYGSAISSKMCLEILQEESNYKVKHIKLNYSGSIEGVGDFSFKKFFWSFIVIYRILRAMAKDRYRIIYFVPATAGIALYRDFVFLKILKLSYNSEFILHLRSRFIDEDFDNSFKVFIIKNLLKCDRLILLGKELLSNIHNLFEEDKIIYLHNAIAVSLSDEDFIKLKENKVNSDKVKILFLSNMAIDKGWLKLLEACVILKQKGFSFECDFVGGWPSNNEKKIFNEFVIANNLLEVTKYQGSKFGNEKDEYLEKLIY